jgi:hypothetical protein
MIGNVAQKRTQVVALAALLALVAAMFVAFAPARAHDLGECANPEYLTQADCEGEEKDWDKDPDTADTAWTSGIRVTGASEDVPSPWTPGTHTASNHPPTLTISFNDTDGVVGDDSTVRVTVTSSGIFLATTTIDEGTAAPGVVLDYVRASGELDHPDQGAAGAAGSLGNLGVSQTASGLDDESASSAIFDLVIPDGTTPGEYTVSARIASGIDYDKDEVTRLTASKVLTVGDPGIGLAAAELALGNRVNDNKGTVEDEAKAESGSDVADGAFTDANPKGINLVVSALNSLGEKSNNGDLGQITVIAPGGDITINRPAGTGPEVDQDPTLQQAAFTSTGSNSVSLSEYVADSGDSGADEVRQTISVTVSKSDKKPGSVDVYAILTGPAGAAVTSTVTLAFTGDASSLELGGPTASMHNQMVETLVAEKDTDHRDVISFALGASDAGGNDAVVPTVRTKITDPDGKTVSTTRIARAQGANAVGTPNAKISLSSMGIATAPLAGGEYTLTVTSGDNSAEVTFFVAGAADGIAIETASSSDPVALGSVVTVTANVSDGEAVPVADGTLVEFTSAGALELKGVGAVAGVKTKAGVASARFVVSKGSGLAAIIVSSGTASNSTAISAGAAAEEVEAVSLDCLTETSGFSVYTCGVDSSASELFGLVSGRGATAVHLWNGSDWVRYSVVDGAMVPGSSDFTVTDNDILYISN